MQVLVYTSNPAYSISSYGDTFRSQLVGCTILPNNKVAQKDRPPGVANSECILAPLMIPFARMDIELPIGASDDGGKEEEAVFSGSVSVYEMNSEGSAWKLHLRGR
eukprot:scaffold5321_cov126-Cylindrotheca_fusiformis.AAC.1